MPVSLPLSLSLSRSGNAETWENDECVSTNKSALNQKCLDPMENEKAKHSGEFTKGKRKRAINDLNGMFPWCIFVFRVRKLKIPRWYCHFVSHSLPTTIVFRDWTKSGPEVILVVHPYSSFSHHIKWKKIVKVTNESCVLAAQWCDKLCICLHMGQGREINCRRHCQVSAQCWEGARVDK